MGTNISIRRATPTDAFETAAVFSAALKSMTFFPKLHSDLEDRDFVRGFIESSETWIAISDGRVIGLACLEGDWLAHLYVDPFWHDRGVGTLLLERVKEARPARTASSFGRSRPIPARGASMSATVASPLNSPTAAATKRNCRM